MIRALIFDMDGLLVNTEPLWREAEIREFAKVGLNLTPELCKRTMGMRIVEVVDYWYRRQPWTGKSCAEVTEGIVDEMERLILEQVAPLEGVEYAIREAARARFPMAIASSSHGRLIDAVAKRLNLEDTIQIRCSAEQEAYGKPHPAVFLTAAKKLAVDPHECLVFEDSVTGVIAARAAGMQVVAIPEESDRELPQFSIAHAIWPSMTYFRIASIKEGGV